MTRNSKRLIITVIAICTITSCFISFHVMQTSWTINHDELPEEEGEGEGEEKETTRAMMLLAKLEAKAIQLLYSKNQKGLSHAMPPQIHYAFTTFQLSLGKSTSFKYTITSYQNGKLLEQVDDDTNNISSSSSISYNKQVVVCEMNKLQSLNMNHIPHFAQVAFPCWSVLQQFPNAKRYIKLNDFQLKDLSSPWIMDLMKTFQDAGIIIFDDHGQNQNNIKAAIEKGWRISIDKRNSGGFPREVGDAKYSIENSKYFLNHHLDVQALQRQVLGENYFQHYNQKRHGLPLRALLIDRAGVTREWVYSHETALQINKVWGEDIHVKIISNLNGTLKEQALEFHNSDIIISPHGAQLTNLAFIRPCTAVLELFPRSYYLGYFQPLVLSAGGIALDGYPYDRNALADTASAQVIANDVKTRERLRRSSIHASPDSILRVLPNVISQMLSCRRGWEGYSNNIHQ